MIGQPRRICGQAIGSRNDEGGQPAPVSYYDYYQPEAYVPRTDTYVEKESSINEQIDRMRHSATRALLERDDVVIVASVSCIYGIGSVETYQQMTAPVKVGQMLMTARDLLRRLVELQYRRNDTNFHRGTFRVRGDTVEIFPAHYEDRAWRVSLFGDEVEAIHEFDPLTGEKTAALEPRSTSTPTAITSRRARRCSRRSKQIKEDLKARLEELTANGKPLEAERLEQRTTFDLEMMEATGSCAGIENYSRYLTGRAPGEPPPTLFEYLPEDALLIVDESHVTVPQIGGMFRGDGRASRPWPSTASACRPASTTGRSSSRNGRPCGRRRSTSRPPPATGSWSAPAASSPSRWSARPA